jgi:uncharacterized protein
VTTYALSEGHRFRGSSSEFLYLVPSGGIFAIDRISAAILDTLGSAGGPLDRDQLIGQVSQKTAAAPLDVLGCVHELSQVRAIRDTAVTFTEKPAPLPENFPLQTMVMNVTNQCNLSCQYCYEFGEDKIATPEGKKKFMDVDTAKTSVDYLFAQSEGRKSVHITFFGGETLMNFPLLRQIVDYSTEQAARKSMKIDFSLTTNATLLTPQIIDFLAVNRVGVTVSIDGPKEMNDKFRVFSNGRGSYEIMEPKVRELLARHHTRPIAARVTMTSGAMDALKIYRHLKHDLGFHEVGFAPVTTSPDRLYSINEPGMHHVFSQFGELAKEYLQFALRGELHGFSNVSDTLAELHQGVNKSHPCGAGLGLIGVGPSGDIAPCHRFVDSDEHVLGNVSTGIDKKKQNAFLDRGHIQGKHDCHTCWARPLCAGGCHHEAFVRYGDTGHPNLHYCDWIRGWTNTCLEIYGTLAERNPQFLEYFAERKAS